MIYKIREEQIRIGISKDKAVSLIEEKYHEQYDPNGGLNVDFDAWDQLLACEAIAEATPIPNKYFEEKERTNENVNVNGSVNGSYKHKVDFELTQRKLNVIERLKTFTYRTPPTKVAELLEEFFHENHSKPGHWLYIAQHYTPRIICWNLSYMTKVHDIRGRTFQNWAAYFTETIKLRKKRRSF